jgi:hypothetical protein
LHHRHPHKLHESHKQHESNINSSNNNNGGLFRRPAMPTVFHHPSNSKLSSSKVVKQSTRSIKGWILQYFIPLVILGFIMASCFYGHYYYMQKYNVDKSRRDEERHQEERWREMLKDANVLSDGGLVSSLDALNSNIGSDSKSRKKFGSKGSGGTSGNSRRGRRKSIVSSTFLRRVLDSYNRQSGSSKRHTKRSNFVSFGFDPKQTVSYEQPTTEQTAYQKTEHWYTSQLQTHAQIANRQIEARRKRTSGGLSSSSSSNVNHITNNVDLESIGAIKTNSGLLPLWYELNHLTKDTMQSLHRRWKRNDETTINQAATKNPDEFAKDFNLCGIHAQTAAQIYPQNYYPSDSTTNFNSHHSPLGPSSRVLITGILSPLGMHLAIALSRQCNITSFLGIDTQMPNDPLSRLEQQDRLAVLMEELVDLKSLQVPFLGVQTKQRGKRTYRQEGEAKAREEALIRLYLHGNLDEEYTNLPKEYMKPYTMYGIPNSPGIHPEGHGALEILLEYRPTHVVHLAGTQSESFTSAKDVQDYDAGQDENDSLLKESISTKPHLYELRMRSTGMEQLLSAIVAQGMLPPRYGRDYGEDHSEEEEEVKKLSRDDLFKMKRPHFVYASSHDAGYFGDLASRVNHKGDSDEGSEEFSNVNDGEEQRKEDLATSPSTLQAPPRGLNGVSGLIDEVLASTYYALYGVSSVGLRFDAVYGPRGFGVPSTSVPIYNVHRIRRGGVSSDVDLAETAVRRLYRNWVKVVKEKEGKEEGDTDIDTSLIEEAGWSHAAHDPRDFVFVEGEVEHFRESFAS